MYVGALIFREIYRAKPWGGRAMARVAAKRLPPGVPIGESWEIADHPHGTSVVARGPLAGRTLRELTARHGDSLLGRPAGRSRFPLLVKILDAREQLSVQVHPDDRCARAMGINDPGKTEAWYVLDRRAGAAMVVGLKSKRDIPRLASLAHSGALGSRLRVIRPRKGQALLCRAGAVHALGPGVVLLEIQQNSDATFRLYDWGRVGLDGKPRRLHIAQAVRAVGNTVRTVRPGRPKRLAGMPFAASRLVSCGKFVIDRWRIRRPALRCRTGRFEILHVVRGSGTLCDAEWPELRLRRGRTVLVPACVGDYQIRPRGAVVIVRAAEPE